MLLVRSGPATKVSFRDAVLRWSGQPEEHIQAAHRSHFCVYLKAVAENSGNPWLVSVGSINSFV